MMMIKWGGGGSNVYHRPALFFSLARVFVFFSFVLFSWGVPCYAYAFHLSFFRFPASFFFCRFVASPD
jgi:hypothetical protein